MEKDQWVPVGREPLYRCGVGAGGQRDRELWVPGRSLLWVPGRSLLWVPVGPVPCVSVGQEPWVLVGWALWLLGCPVGQGWGFRETHGAGSHGAEVVPRPRRGAQDRDCHSQVTPGRVPEGAGRGVPHPDPQLGAGPAVPCAPSVGLGSWWPHGPPWATGTKRLWQPHGLDTAVSRQHSTVSVDPAPASPLPWRRGDPHCIAPDHQQHRGQRCQHPACARQAPAVPAGAGSDGRAGPWQLGWSRRRPSRGGWEPGKCLEMVNRLPLYGSAALARLRPRSAACPARHPHAMPRRGPFLRALGPTQECATGPAILRRGEKSRFLCAGPCLSFPRLGGFGALPCRSQPGCLGALGGLGGAAHPAGGEGRG